MTGPEKGRRPLLHGRRRGHALRPGRQRLLEAYLPRLRLDLGAPAPRSLGSLFGRPVDEVWLEIGFGAGEHLASQARAHPATGIIGAEVFVNGIARLIADVAADDLKNIRIHDGDARDLLDWLPAASLKRVFVLFPDPWPKKRHHKRRLLGTETLARTSRLLVAGGELRVATDIADYARAILIAATREGTLSWQARAPRDWRERPDDWPPTRYEAKARAAGRPCHYLRFVK